MPIVRVEGQSFSAEGDSGSLLVTQGMADPVALLVASSDTETVAAPVADVLAALADLRSGEQPVFVGTASTHTVAGCALPGAQIASGSTTVRSAAASQEKMRAAASIRDAYASELLHYPQVRAMGIGLAWTNLAKPQFFY
jgi:hypothetical protein